MISVTSSREVFWSLLVRCIYSDLVEEKGWVGFAY